MVTQSPLGAYQVGPRACVHDAYVSCSVACHRFKCKCKCKCKYNCISGRFDLFSIWVAAMAHRELLYGLVLLLTTYAIYPGPTGCAHIHGNHNTEHQRVLGRRSHGDHPALRADRAAGGRDVRPARLHAL